MQVLPLNRLGARERPDVPGVVDFGLFLPGVTPADGTIVVRILHEDDEFVENVRPFEIALTYDALAEGERTYGHHWCGSVDVFDPRIRAGKPRVTSAQGPQRYAYHYALVDRPRGLPPIGPIIDPFTREYGCGDLPVITAGTGTGRENVGLPLGAGAHAASLARFAIPPLEDAVIYEINLALFDGDLAKTLGLLDHLSEIGVGVLQVAPVDDDAAHVAWGYDPVGYLELPALPGGGADVAWLVTAAHERGIAMVVDSMQCRAEIRLALGGVHRARSGPGVFGRSPGDPGIASATWDFCLTRDVFLVETFGVDGFRYGRSPGGEGAAPDFTELARATRAHVGARVRALDPLYRRFAPDTPSGEIKLIQLADCAPEPPSARGEPPAPAARKSSAGDAKARAMIMSLPDPATN